MESSPSAAGRARVGAFTLLELLVVVTIILILATLAVPGYKRIRQNAEKVLCMGNLRVLHVAFNSYVQDQKQWPQEPENLARDAAEKWWIDEVERYGADPQAWICPAFLRVHEEDPKRYREIPRAHYVATHFDEFQFTPYKWSTMPWLIEIGNFHGGGNLIIFPDGAIKTFGEVMEAQALGQGNKKGEDGGVELSISASVPGTEEASTPAPGKLTLTRSGKTTEPLEVAWKLSGSATKGFDYLDLPEVVKIPPGSSSFTIEVVPIDDSSVEEEEEIIVTLEKGPYKIVGEPSAKIVIKDDDKDRKAAKP